MANNTKKDQQEEEEYFSLREFLSSCLFYWKWFALSLVFFIGVGVLYYLRQEPEYKRTMAVLVTDQEGGGGIDMSSAFSMAGLFSSNSKVNNELIAMTSPAIISEVVTRLDLTMSYSEKGLFHNTSLFGTSAPFTVKMPDLGQEKTGGFRVDVAPNGTAKLYKFWAYDENGDKVKFDKVINTRVSFNNISTPLGRVSIQPNGAFTGSIDEEKTYLVAHSGYLGTVESYNSMLKGDLADQDADVINLTIEDSNKERANAILNTVIAVYNENWVEDKNRLAVATSNFITERLNVIERELGNVDNDISEFKSKNKVPDLAASLTATLQQNTQLQQQVTLARNSLEMTKYVKEYLANPKHSNDVIPVNVGLDDNILASAISQYNTLLMERQTLVDNSGGESNPLVREADKRLNVLRESVIRSMNNRIGTLEASLRDMEREQGGQDHQLETAPVQAKYLLSIERQQKVKEELYVFLLQKREENELSQAFTAYNTRIITPPWGSKKPVSPKRNLILAFSFLLGLALPTVVLYLVESANTKIRSRKDLESLQMPFAGEIPLIGKKKKFARFFMTKKQKEREKEAPKPVVKEGNRDIPNEAFRVVRSNMDFMIGKGRGGSVLMLTSFNPGSGKSFVAYNLGASFALKKKRVLLIDGDLRHGSLSTYCGSPKKGISNYLTGNVTDWESLVSKNAGIDGLDILPIGHRPPNPAELLENGGLERLIAEAREKYDIVMIDCPPVNIVVDTQIINEFVDRTIFVVRAGLLERSAVKEISKLNEQNKLKHMSVLLNGTNATFSSYYHYGNYSAFE